LTMAGHIVVRLVLIFAGLAAAYLAAGIFLSIGLFGDMLSDLFAGSQIPPGEQGPITTFAVLVLGLVSSFQIASLALAPSALAVLVAELAGWRGLTVNLVLGGLVGLAVGWMLTGGAPPGTISGGAALVLLSAGFVGAFFYWLIAGRGAGGWRG
jgi:hypothetical protein